MKKSAKAETSQNPKLSQKWKHFLAEYVSFMLVQEQQDIYEGDLDELVALLKNSKSLRTETLREIDILVEGIALDIQDGVPNKVTNKLGDFYYLAEELSIPAEEVDFYIRVNAPRG